MREKKINEERMFEEIKAEYFADIVKDINLEI